MANLEARVTELEGQAQSHNTALDGLRGEVVELRADLRTSIAQVRSEMAQMRGEMATRTDIADVRREMADVRREMGDLRTEVNRHFVWLTGIMVSGFITMIGAMVAVVFQINSIR